MFLVILTTKGGGMFTSEGLLFARRGIGRLIEGLTNGDPIAWTVLGAVVVIGVGVAVYKAKTKTE